ncbi:MAG TPA: hypothetical protein VGE98_14165 [Thermoanaerobaculia bacterium]
MAVSPTDSRRPLVLAILAYTLLALVDLRPVWRTFSTHLAPNAEDPLFNLVVLQWGAHQARLYWPAPFDMPFFFPAKSVATYSDVLFGPSLFTAAVEAAGGGALVAYNLLLVGSFVLCAGATYFVLRRCDLSPAAAFAGGLMFAFSPFRFEQLGHLQVLLAGFIPLVFWTFDRLLAAPSGRRAAAFLLVYALHVTGGSYLAYMIHFPLAVLAVNRLGDLRRSGDLRRQLAILLPTALAAGLLLFAVFRPYLDPSRGDLKREPWELYAYGASLAGLVTPSEWNFYNGPWADGWKRQENALFAGLLPTILGLAAAAGAWRRHRAAPLRPLRERDRLAIGALAALGIAGWAAGETRIWTGTNPLARWGFGGPYSWKSTACLLVAGLGAVFLYRARAGRWPLDLTALPRFSRGLAAAGLVSLLLAFPFVYEPLAHVVPGLAGMRVPARFYAFVSFALAFFAARELDRWLGRSGEGRARRGLLAGSATAFLIVELFPRQIPWALVPDVGARPPVYAWIAGHPEVRALLELPLGEWRDEVVYMENATEHWRPLVNGFSGYTPRHYVDLLPTVRPLPTPAALEKLRAWGVTHVLIHGRHFRARWERRSLNEWAWAAGASQVYKDRFGDRVYRLEN